MMLRPCQEFKGEKLLIKYNEQNIGQNLKNCNPEFANKSLKT